MRGDAGIHRILNAAWRDINIGRGSIARASDPRAQLDGAAEVALGDTFCANARAGRLTVMAKMPRVAGSFEPNVVLLRMFISPFSP
jgi:hypothetical protein